MDGGRGESGLVWLRGVLSRVSVGPRARMNHPKAAWRSGAAEPRDAVLSPVAFPSCLLERKAIEQSMNLRSVAVKLGEKFLRPGF